MKKSKAMENFLQYLEDHYPPAYLHYQGYDLLIWANGDVYNDKTGKIYQPRKCRNGYMLICLQGNGGRVEVYQHRLVAQAFYGSIPAGYDIDHIDMDKTCNRLSNLEPVSRAENMRRMWAKRRGEVA